jgi:hypothetical protein
VSGLPVAAGDTVVTEVWNTSPTNGYAFLENISTGKYAAFNLTAPSGTTLQGTSAEWVVERPAVNGALARLTNYVGDAFTNTYAGGYNYQVVYYPGTDYTPTGTVYSIDMLDNNSKVISYSILNGLFGIWYFDTEAQEAYELLNAVYRDALARPAKERSTAEHNLIATIHNRQKSQLEVNSSLANFMLIKAVAANPRNSRRQLGFDNLSSLGRRPQQKLGIECPVDQTRIQKWRSS